MSQLFGSPVQVASVVTDIDSAITRMLVSGIGPVYTMRHIRSPARYRGERNDVLISAAFAYSGNIQYEFLQQHDSTPSAYIEYLARHPEGGLHHFAYLCDDFEHSLERAAAAGIEFRIVQEYITADGIPYEVYLEPVDAEDPLLVQLNTPGPISDMFEAMEQATKDWDGKDPIRDALKMLPEEMRPPVEARE